MTIKKFNVDILIPAFNEEKTIKKIVKDCFKITRYDVRILVFVDSKTTDNTFKEANKTGATVIKVKKSKGKGDNIKFAIPYLKGEFVVQIDADHQFQPYEIPKLVDPLINGYDITLGTRYQKGSNVEKNSINFTRLIGSYILSFLTSIFSFQRITDVMAGFKGFRISVLKDLNPQAFHFGYEAELVIKGAQKKYKILNVPITYKNRHYGKSTVNSIKHGLLVLGTIVKTGLKL